jgi:hypothetical protein
MLYLLSAMNAVTAIGFFPTSPLCSLALGVAAIGCLITQIAIELMD